MNEWMLTENEITKICGWPSTPVYNMIAETNKAQAKKLLEYQSEWSKNPNLNVADLYSRMKRMLEKLK